MNLVCGYDYKELVKIAKATENTQLKRDVQYCRIIAFNGYIYCERIDNICFFAGADRKDLFKLICIGVAKPYQGRGYGRFMLQRVISHAKEKGYKKIITRTKNAVDFYQKWGGAKITGIADEDFIMEIEL